jgi:8-oxo-dGTP diphosphatase
MGIGRFYGGIAALIWSPADDKYLLLKRSSTKDFASDAWECVTGRVDQGEGFEQALHREVFEELGVEVRIEFMVGTTHFYRGPVNPENELIGVVCCCSLDDPGAIRLSAEHSDYRWVTAQEAEEMLSELGPSTRWIKGVVQRADALKRLLSAKLRSHVRQTGIELD